MRAQGIREDDEFWAKDELIWIAKSDAHIINAHFAHSEPGDLIVQVHVMYRQDGGQNYRYFNIDQEVRVKHGNGLDATG